MTLLIATRRRMLAVTLAGLAAPALAATGVPEAVTLLAPGPEIGPGAGFARRVAAGLPRELAQAAAFRVSLLGGPDGITAANRFAASTPADGRLLLALPGVAMQALLLGESRARFEPRTWPALAGSVMPAILAGRGPLGALERIRLALPGPTAAESAGLLALDLLGRPASPVFPAGGVTVEQAVAAGAADALVLAGPGAARRAAALGLDIWFAFDNGDAALPGVAMLADLLPDPPAPDLLAALRAGGAALGARGLLVLPALTSADVVAMWRDAARRWVEAEPDGTEPGARHIPPEAASRVLAALCPGPEACFAYRDWVQRRFAWRAT
jgi:hypothetical protein